MRAALLCLVLAGCNSPTTPNPNPSPTPTPTPGPDPTPSTSTPTSTEMTILTDPAQLDAHVGKVVTLRGTLTRTKIPTILGVDVAGPAPDALADQPAEATGTLEREVVTQAELDEQIARMGQFANRGAGTFYRLVSPDGAGLAAPRAAAP